LSNADKAPDKEVSMSYSKATIFPGSPVLLSLHSPKEKLWGLLQEISGAGIFMVGIDINTFDDWVRMIVRGERNIGLSTVFFPMWRVERVSLDQSVDDIPSMADTFYDRVGMTLEEYLGDREV
jgi:hypothetical protein